MTRGGTADEGTMTETARRRGRIAAHRTLSLLAATGVCCCLSVATSSQAGATPVWLGPRHIGPPGRMSGAGVALDGKGDVAAAWAGPGEAIEIAFRPAGGLWQVPLVISQGVGGVEAPLVATSATGEQMAVIWGREGTIDVSEGSLSGFRLHAPTMLSPESQGAGEPDLAMNATGDEVSGWWNYERFEKAADLEQRTKAAELDFRAATSAPWAGPLVISETSPRYDAGAPPQVAIGAGGDAVAAWSRFTRTFPLTKEASFRPAGGGWQPPVAIPGASTFSPIRLGVDARGDAVAVWESGESQEQERVEASVRPAASGTWQPPQVVAQYAVGAPSLSRDGQRSGPNPALAVGADGEAVIAWEAIRGERRVVEVAAGSASTGVWQPASVLAAWPDWSSTGLVDLPPEGYPGPTPIAHPSVALAGDGEALVAWDDASSHSAGTVEAAVRPAAGSGWEAPVAVGSAATEGVQVAADALGEAAVVWSGEDAIESDILAPLGITGARLSHERFRLHRRPSRVRAPFGARLRFHLSGPAQVTVAVAAYRGGVQVDGECGPGAPRRSPDTLTTCTRRIPLGGWVQTEPAGADKVELTRRLTAMGLHPGMYRLTVSAANDGELAPAVSLPFYIARWGGPAS
jgi:hypothetical protein